MIFMHSDYLLVAILLTFFLLLGFSFFIVARQGMGERKPVRREALSDHLQWGALVAPGIILNKNRTLLRTIAFRGPDLAASSDEEMMVVTAKVNNALKRLDTG